MKNKHLIFITQAAAIAAMYAVLTLAQGAILPYLTFGPVQFRVSEVLTILAFYTPAAIPGLTLGCVIGNMLSSLGFLDMVFGPIASLLAALTMYGLRNVRFKTLPLVGSLMPALWNGLIVGFTIELTDAISRLSTSGGELSFYFVNFLIWGGWVALGELGVLLILGIPFCKVIEKTGLDQKIQIA